MLGGDGSNIVSVNHRKGSAIGTTDEQRKSHRSNIGGGIGRGIGKQPRLSAACSGKHNCYNCYMHQCTCDCHEMHRIK